MHCFHDDIDMFTSWNRIEPVNMSTTSDLVTRKRNINLRTQKSNDHMHNSLVSPGYCCRQQQTVCVSRAIATRRASFACSDRKKDRIKETAEEKNKWSSCEGEGGRPQFHHFSIPTSLPNSLWRRVYLWHPLMINFE